MKTYTYQFPLYGMADCLSDRILLGHLPILAEVSEVHEDGNFQADIFIADQRKMYGLPSFNRSSARLHEGQFYVKPDYDGGLLRWLGASILSFLDDQNATFISDAREMGSLLVFDPYLDDYRRLSDVDGSVDLRPFHHLKDAA